MANGKTPEKPVDYRNSNNSSYSKNYKRKYDDYFAKEKASSVSKKTENSRFAAKADNSIKND